MAQQWAENNSEIEFEIVCSLDLKKQTKKTFTYSDVTLMPTDGRWR